MNSCSFSSHVVVLEDPDQNDPTSLMDPKTSPIPIGLVLIFAIGYNVAGVN